MIAWALLRAAGSTVVLVVIYYLLPLDHTARWAAIVILVIGLAGLSTLVTFQVRSIIASLFPGLRAVVPGRPPLARAGSGSYGTGLITQG